MPTSRRARGKRPHVLILVQNLPVPFDRRVWQEALALVEVIQDFLAQPTEAEARYIGVALQARFSVTLLG